MARNDGIQITDESLLPDGADLEPDVDGGGEINIGELRVNFSAEEESSEARDFSPIPTGKYHVAITDVEVKQCGPNSKNPGKPFYAVTVTIQDGDHMNRKLWGNVMLFEGALYSLVQILKAQSLPLSGKVPTPDELIGTHYLCQIANQVDTYKINKSKEDGSFDPKEPTPRKNEIKNWGRYNGVVSGTSGTSGSAGDSMLP